MATEDTTGYVVDKMAELVKMSSSEVNRYVDALTVSEYRELRRRINEEFDSVNRYKSRLITFNDTVKNRVDTVIT